MSVNNRTVKNKKADVPFSNIQNDFEKVAIIATRAKQLLEHNTHLFQEGIEKLAEVEGINGNLKSERNRQLLSKRYEQMKNPVVQAIQELQQGEILHNYTIQQR